jgi:integrase
VFTGNYGTPKNPRTLNRRFTTRCDQAGVRHMTVHDARRTCATLLVDVEVHPRVIMRIRCQADVSMTLGIYGNACADGAARSAARAGGARSMRRSILVFVAVLAVFCCCTGIRGPHQLW